MKKVILVFTLIFFSSCAVKKVSTTKTVLEQTTDTVMIEPQNPKTPNFS